MKKLLTIALCASMAMAFTACAKDKGVAELPETTQSEVTEEKLMGGMGGTVQIPNPFTDCETLKDAEELSGVSIQMPSHVPNWMNDMVFRAKQNDMLEVIIKGINDEEIRIRKAVGNDDISGDYNVYDESYDMPIGEKNVAVKGNDGKISLAVWQSDGFTYAVSFKDAMDKEDVEFILEDVK